MTGHRAYPSRIAVPNLAARGGASGHLSYAHHYRGLRSAGQALPISLKTGAPGGSGPGGGGAFDILLTSLYFVHMADVLEAAKGATKLFLEFSSVTIDNAVFKLFYRGTTTLLVMCSVLASSKQIFGDPISCGLHMGSGIKDDVLNSFCWMYSSFTIPSDFQGSCIKREPDPTALYNSYYQWVPLFLTTQAMMFCLPRMVWLMMEGGMMKFLTAGTTGKVIEEPSKKKAVLVDTFKNHLRGKYDVYAIKFFVCEQLNFVTLILTWFITDKFLKGQFMTYGIEVMSYFSLPPEEREKMVKNPMCEVFPRIAACNFFRYGTAGRQETANAICVLNLNMINDKLFLVLWVWYIFLTLCMAHRMVLRMLQLLFPKVRYHLLMRIVQKYLTSSLKIKMVEQHVRNCGIGDWFVLCQMCKNMNKRFFCDFLVSLVEHFGPPIIEITSVESQDDMDEDRMKRDEDIIRRRKPSTVSYISELFDMSGRESDSH